MTKEEKRAADYAKLAKLAAQARKMRDIEALKATSELEQMAILAKPLNRYIKKIYNLGNAEIKTFKQWKDAGYLVKKGEKGYLFFSTPKTFKKEVETKKGKEEIAFSRFCKCYLFSQEQVEKLA